MVFSSITFLLFFFPILLALYWATKKDALRNILLLAASLLFYAWGEPVYVFLLIFSVLINWFLALLIAKSQSYAKVWLWLAVVLNVGMLIVFKYSGFLVSTANELLLLSLPVPRIRLPIGISFFTFQVLSYVIDVYRNRTMVQKNIFSLLLYVSFFPQLIAGPIVKYYDIRDQLTYRSLTLDCFSVGMRRFIYGLAKKVLLSNSLAVFVDLAYAQSAEQLTTPLAWLAAVAYMLQIYYDFSGYSDMAIGLGRIFGFDFKENFNYPYAAVGIKQFWRRWHISLSTWFREYLYIPLGGNRKGTSRTLINQFIVFASTGLWHGANFTFLLWGLIHGLFLTLESSHVLPIERIAQKPFGEILCYGYTWFVVLITFVLFRSDSISYAWNYINVMFTNKGSGTAIELTAAITPYFVATVLVSVVFSFPLLPKMKQLIGAYPLLSRVYMGISYAMSILLLLLCIGALAANTYNPFIYFRF